MVVVETLEWPDRGEGARKKRPFLEFFSRRRKRGGRGITKNQPPLHQRPKKSGHVDRKGLTTFDRVEGYSSLGFTHYRCGAASALCVRERTERKTKQAKQKKKKKKKKRTKKVASFDRPRPSKALSQPTRFSREVLLHDRLLVCLVRPTPPSPLNTYQAALPLRKIDAVWHFPNIKNQLNVFFFLKSQHLNTTSVGVRLLSALGCDFCAVSDA
jgi:hypothetical protein